MNKLTICSQSLTPGAKIGIGDWTIERQIGEGAYGYVVQVTNSKNEMMACKVLSLRLGAKLNNITIDEQKKAVMKEINILKYVQEAGGSDHIIRMYQFTLKSNTIYILFEFIDDGELFDKIEINVGMKVENAQNYFKQLMNGVKFLHDRYIAHRDIKPENLLVTKSDRLIITDFGFSEYVYDKHSKKIIKSSNRCGTRMYLAPEVLVAGEEHKFNALIADIWSCGVVLFAMLFGQMPFFEASRNDELYCRYKAHVSEQRKTPDWQPYIKTTPEALKCLCACLYPDTKQRATAQQALETRFVTRSHKLQQAALERFGFKTDGVNKRPKRRRESESQALKHCDVTNKQSPVNSHSSDERASILDQLTITSPAKKPRRDTKTKEDCVPKRDNIIDVTDYVGVYEERPKSRQEFISFTQPTESNQVISTSSKKDDASNINTSFDNDLMKENIRHRTLSSLAHRFTRIYTQQTSEVVFHLLENIMNTRHHNDAFVFTMRNRNFDPASKRPVSLMLNVQDINGTSAESDSTATLMMSCDVYDLKQERMLDFRRARGDGFQFQAAFKQLKSMLADAQTDLILNKCDTE